MHGTEVDIPSEISTAIAEILETGDFGVDSKEIDVKVRHPDNEGHGEYMSGVAMAIGKAVKQNPQQVAEKIHSMLEKKIRYIDRIEIAGSGFLNFHLTRDFFSEQVARIAHLGDQWGMGTDEQGQEVLIEYTSPNLFKPLHIGNLVGNITGESIARLFEMKGATVRRINYPSDIGLTVAKGVWGIQKTNGNPENILDLGEAYRVGEEQYKNNQQAKKEIEDSNQKLYKGGDTSIEEIWKRGKKTSMEHLDMLCKHLGTKFDTVIFESEISDIGYELVHKHIDDGIFEKDDNAIIFRGEKYGLHTRVFVNSRNLPTYEAKDLGNFMQKQKRYPEWKKSIVITGNEQQEYFQVLNTAIKQVFPSAQKKIIEHISTGFLTLSTGKMSSRKGNVLTGESLLADLQKEAIARAKETRSDDSKTLSRQIAVAALKYQILRRTVGSEITFDKKQAFSFEGDSGPYIQYTYVRCKSVLEKAQAVQTGIDVVVPKTVYPIERHLYRFGEITASALAKRSPHLLVAYLTKIAGLFNTLYATERIVDSKDAYAPYKIAITRATAQTIKNGLWALGIEAPEKM